MRTQTESIARRAAKDITKGYDIKVRIEMAIEQALAQRTWIGLTEQERNDIEDYCEMMIGKPAFDAIEAKLKEKNT
jgi:hypothetical protein